MSDAVAGALIGTFSALAGTTLTFIFETWRRTRERDAEASRSLRSQRADAYRSFLREVLLTAHELAKAANVVPGSIEERQAAASLVNKRVTAAILELELIAEPATFALARELQLVMVEYRTLVLNGASSVGEEWRALGEQRYLPARAAFQSRARMEILGVGASESDPGSSEGHP
jgi:hypothetical protein